MTATAGHPPSIAGLRNLHQGRPAVVIGGGPSLPDQAWRFPRDAVVFGVNGHGLKARDEGLVRRCDYTVYLDKAIGPGLMGRGSTVISPHTGACDLYYLRSSDVWDAGFTSGVAAWLALFAGCDPVLLAGMDCYTGGTYWHDDEAVSSGSWQSLDKHLAGWRRAFKHCPHADRIMTMGGPTAEVFPAWTK